MPGDEGLRRCWLLSGQLDNVQKSEVIQESKSFCEVWGLFTFGVLAVFLKNRSAPRIWRPSELLVVVDVPFAE